MPMHDWTRVSSGTYHDFHEGWTIRLRDDLNQRVLPAGFYAMADQRVRGPEPDVATFTPGNGTPTAGGLAVLDAPPKARLQAKVELSGYARKANRLRVYGNDDRVVAVVELVSPGNKDNRHAVRAFVDKAVEFLTHGIHLLIVDPFPPTPRDPGGLHRLIWEEMGSEPFPERPADEPLTAMAFDADVAPAAYVEPFAVGDPVPTMPLFLAPGRYVNVPLEDSYRASWDVLPAILKARVLSPQPG
jgi:hypothetical protein